MDEKKIECVLNFQLNPKKRQKEYPGLSHYVRPFVTLMIFLELGRRWEICLFYMYRRKKTTGKMGKTLLS